MKDNQAPGLYILMLSVHGLIRSNQLELGRDADTGGQIKYVIELAQALGKHPDVARLDLITREVRDPSVDEVYARAVETLGPGVSIVRVPCGPDEYLRKERLWRHLDAFADEVLNHIQRVGRVPDIIHSHYADAGYVGTRLAAVLDVPLVHTGHSLGRVKRERLMAQGLTANEIEEHYHMSERIAAEEKVLEAAAMIVASTRQEIDEQYSAYDAYDPKPMMVIPPGVDLSRFHPPTRGLSRPPISAELRRFLTDPGKPMILALSRPDRRKNIASLLQAYGESPALQHMANLVIVLGSREEIESMEEGPRGVLTELLLLIDKYDLYGKVAYPKQHAPDDVPQLYRLAAKSRGVFINPALTEPFGLTLLEAAASGLPVVATHDGGPRDILAMCKNGLLVDPLDIAAIAQTLHEALADTARWRRWSQNGVAGVHRHFSWTSHTNKYVKELRARFRRVAPRRIHALLGRHHPGFDRVVICDVDNTLVGDAPSLRNLIDTLKRSPERIGFGIATGRRLESAREILAEWGVPDPDIYVTAVGSEIHHGASLQEDSEWAEHIAFRWRPDALRKAMRAIPGLELQVRSEQRKFKISYNVDPRLIPSVAEIERFLRVRELHANVIYSHRAYLDLLPIRASKGAAIRFLALKWGLPLGNVLVAGDSGNDIEMLRGATLGVVVGNHSQELAPLAGYDRIYFAAGQYAAGVVEGLQHYGFVPSARVEPLQERAV
jgi:sucrose-phosphate synthase